ncbi:MAG TPA: hypothetical protein VHY34_02845 [Caulobacteraceae bacterium]|nr:hypothetical protein [Caulobacteraceae bacterium]
MPIEVDLAVRPAQVVGDVEIGAVGQFGQRIANRLEDRDAGVVQIVVRPDGARSGLNPIDREAAQSLKAHHVAFALRAALALD